LHGVEILAGRPRTLPRRDDLGVATDTALLMMDLQNWIVERYGAESPALLDAVSAAATAARVAGVPVIHVRLTFREGAPEVSRRSRMFSTVASMPGLGDDDPPARIHPAVAPHPGDIIVTKKRVSAFTGSDLEIILRSLEVRSLALAGIATSGVVLSTLLQASDLDYQITVLRDGCADADPEVHRILMEKVFARRADVATTGEWMERLPGETG
jgi:nicotinamidase-related amidase